MIRLSGADALGVLARVFTPKNGSVAEMAPRVMTLGEVRGGGIADECMCAVFPAPHSYTGENSAEIYCHGGAALVVSVLRLLLDNGAAAADKGEFTKRAFINGRLDLSRAEGVADLINAECAAELSAGFDLLSGKLKAAVAEIQDGIKAYLAEIDAACDYPDEYDGEDLSARIDAAAAGYAARLYALADTYKNGRLIRDGINCAILGAPNVGKSSLLNAILREERAIVSPVPGTTRDTLRETFTSRGFKINLTDTAGIRKTGRGVESQGIERALLAARAADIVLYVVDASDTFADKNTARDIKGNAADKTAANTVADENKTAAVNKLRKNTKTDKDIADILTQKKYITVLNKCDLSDAYKGGATRVVLNGGHTADAENKGGNAADGNEYARIYVSAKDGTGIDGIAGLIADACIDGHTDTGGLTLTSLRHAGAASQAADALSAVSADGVPVDLKYVDLKAAWDALGLITGETAPEAVVDALFSRFCVGK
jgi:tRNA modification GTPase